jgi:hypothetical protein
MHPGSRVGRGTDYDWFEFKTYLEAQEKVLTLGPLRDERVNCGLCHPEISN